MLLLDDSTMLDGSEAILTAADPAELEEDLRRTKEKLVEATEKAQMFEKKFNEASMKICQLTVELIELGAQEFPSVPPASTPSSLSQSSTSSHISQPTSTATRSLHPPLAPLSVVCSILKYHTGDSTDSPFFG